MSTQALRYVSNLVQTESTKKFNFFGNALLRYLSVGSGDALVSLWDSQELICIRTFGRLESAIRTISFTHDNQYIATGSEDLIIDIVYFLF